MRAGKCLPFRCYETLSRTVIEKSEWKKSPRRKRPRKRAAEEHTPPPHSFSFSSLTLSGKYHSRCHTAWFSSILLPNIFSLSGSRRSAADTAAGLRQYLRVLFQYAVARLRCIEGIRVLPSTNAVAMPFNPYLSTVSIGRYCLFYQIILFFSNSLLLEADVAQIFDETTSSVDLSATCGFIPCLKLPSTASMTTNSMASLEHGGT